MKKIILQTTDGKKIPVLIDGKLNGSLLPVAAVIDDTTLRILGLDRLDFTRDSAELLALAILQELGK